MNPTLQPRIFTFYFFSLYFHDPPDPPDLPTYLVFFPARLARARMDGRARRVCYKTYGGEGVKDHLTAWLRTASTAQPITPQPHTAQDGMGRNAPILDLVLTSPMSAIIRQRFKNIDFFNRHFIKFEFIL